jgi:N6-adenosine-specific RNA methylase IME4
VNVHTVRAAAIAGAWPFGPLLPLSYDLIMADPAWPTQMRSPKGERKSSVAKYGAMSWAELEAFPLGELAARDCLLWLWCTWPLLLHGGDPRRHFAGADAATSRPGACMKAWGFRYVTGGAWFKRTRHGKAAFGTGYRLRSCCEPFLIGTIGNPLTTRRERNAIEDLVREHSRKPEAAYALCERWMAGARRVELFSRRSRPGWDTWGLEAGKFDPVITVAAAPL